MDHSEMVCVKEKYLNQKFIVISGPSGGGKTFLINRLNESLDSLYLMVKYTTREPRAGEINNKDYYFVNDFEFLIHSNEFIVTANRYNANYGLDFGEIDKAIELAKTPLCILDPHLAIKFKKIYKNTNIIFISPEVKNDIIKRLEVRADKKENIDSRIILLDEELKLRSLFDFYFDENTKFIDIIKTLIPCLPANSDFHSKGEFYSDFIR